MTLRDILPFDEAAAWQLMISAGRSLASAQGS